MTQNEQRTRIFEAILNAFIQSGEKPTTVQLQAIRQHAAMIADDLWLCDEETGEAT